MGLHQEIDLDTWIVSDTHFGHDNIMQYVPDRIRAMQAQGFADQNEWLIHNWNAVVGKDDLVLHLGDFAFKNAMQEVIARLNGRMILLVGNHDVKKLGWYRDYQQQSPARFELVESVFEVSEPKGVSGLIKELAGRKIFFNHYPLISDDPFLRGAALQTRNVMAQLFSEQNCDLCICGHVHMSDQNFAENEINVSIERIGYQPVRLKKLLMEK